MYRLIVENERGDRMALTGNKNYAIDYLDGFYSSKAAISTAKIGTRDGEKISARTINKKDIGIYLNILQDVTNNRIDLYRIFRMKQKVTIYYENPVRNVKIEGYVEEVNIKPHQKMSTAQIILLCPSPFFEDIKEVIRSLSTIVDNFTFPFSIEESGITFSFIEELTQINAYNHGEVETGMILELKAIGPVVNPIIYDEDSRILGIGTTEVPYIMSAGEIITIDTEKKTVKSTKNLVTINIFNYLRPNSVWFKLKTGDNIIGSGAEEGNTNLRVTVRYSNKYEGV